MSFSPINPLNPAEAVSQSAQEADDLGRSDFLRMLVAQLENQDPLNPQDGTEFTAQLAQFSQLEQLISVRTSVDELVSALTNQGNGELDQLTRGLLAADLIGKDVLFAGNSFEVGSLPEGEAAQPDIRLAFDLLGNTANTTLRIRNSNGVEVGTIERGRLDQGQYEVIWDGMLSDGSRLPPGSYSFDVDATLGGDSVDSVSFVGGRVSGTNLTGDTPMLLIGQLTVPLERVLEVREQAIEL